jgi:prefoldin subunit 5
MFDKIPEENKMSGEFEGIAYQVDLLRYQIELLKAEVKELKERLAAVEVKL